MNKIILDQLKKCNYADLSNFNAETDTFTIKKYSKPLFLTNNCYMVRLHPMLLETNSSLAINWNSGTAPKTTVLKIYVSNQMGKMIYVNSVAIDPTSGKDLNETWSGWLTTDNLEQLN